ncbi:hypothetical protein ACCI36_005035 [Vibrio parahaemolyticus]
MFDALEPMDATSKDKEQSNPKQYLSDIYSWLVRSHFAPERSMTSLVKFKYTPLQALDIDTHELIVNNGYLALNAAMGTGKTQRVAVPFCDNARKAGLIPLVVCHRIALCAELASRTSTVSYENFKGAGAHAADARLQAEKKGMTICLNSLVSPEIQDFLRKHQGKYTLFIDEYQQTVSALAGRHVTKTEETKTALLDIMQHARALVVADADLNDYTLKIANHVRKQDAPVFYAHKDVSDKVINIEFSHGNDTYPMDAVAGALIQAIKRGEQVVIYTNRQRVAMGIKKVLQDETPEAKTLLVCGESKGDELEARLFEADAENESKKYNAIIISPKITSGVSVDNPNFKTAFCFYDGSSIPHYEVTQQMMRFRNVKTFNVVVETKIKSGEYVDFTEADYKHFGEANEYKTNEFNPSDHSSRLIAEVERNQATSLSNFASFLVYRLKRLGYRLNLTGAIPEGILAYPLAEVNKEIAELEALKVLNAETLTRQDYHELKKEGRVITNKQAYQISKYEIKALFNIPEDKPLNSSVLELYNGGRGVAVYRRFCAVMGFMDVDDAEDIEINKNISPRRRKYYRQCADFMKGLFNILYGNMITMQDVILGTLPPLRNSELVEAAKYIEDYALSGVLCHALAKKRVKRAYHRESRNHEYLHQAEPIHDKGRMEAVKVTLERCGFFLESVGRSQTRNAHGKRENEHLYQFKAGIMILMYELGLYQEEKTRLIKELRAKKLEALKQNGKPVGKQLDELTTDELQPFVDVRDCVRAEHDNAPERGWLYSCERCYTPTNGYTCSTCGGRQVGKYIDLNRVSEDALLNAVFSALTYER